jgi:hypothetical protein
MRDFASLLWQIEVAVANGKASEQACCEAGLLSKRTYRWQKEYCGLKVAQPNIHRTQKKGRSRCSAHLLDCTERIDSSYFFFSSDAGRA